MTIEQFKAVYRAKPFRPFTINVADGREVHVRHPEFVSHHPQGRTIIVYGPRDSFEILDLLLISGLAVDNGRGTGRKPRRGRRR